LAPVPTQECACAQFALRRLPRRGYFQYREMHHQDRVQSTEALALSQPASNLQVSLQSHVMLPSSLLSISIAYLTHFSCCPSSANASPACCPALFASTCSGKSKSACRSSYLISLAFIWMSSAASNACIGSAGNGWKRRIVFTRKISSLR